MEISDVVYRMKHPYLSGDLKSFNHNDLKVYEGRVIRRACNLHTDNGVYDDFVVQIDYEFTWSTDKKQWHKAKARPIGDMYMSYASVRPEPDQEWYTTLEAAMVAKLLAIKNKESYVHKTVSEVLKNLEESTKGVDYLLEEYKNNFPDFFV